MKKRMIGLFFFSLLLLALCLLPTITTAKIYFINTPAITNTTGLLNLSYADNRYCLPNGTNCPSSSGGNSSWNQTLASTLYYPLSSNPSNYLTSYTETDPVWTAMKNSLPNLSLAQIVTNIGNWSFEKDNYATITTADARYLRNTSIPTCTSNDKLTSTGNGILSCATDQTGAGDGDGTGGWTNTTTTTITNLQIISNSSIKAFSTIPVIDYQTYECDFLSNFAVSTCLPYYVGAAISTGGTGTTLTGNTTRPGVIGLSKGTAANSGYQYTTSLTAFRLNGSERFVSVTGAYVAAIGTNTTIERKGFLDSITSTAPVDGVYFEQRMNTTEGTGTCIVRNNNVETRATTTTGNYSVLFGNTAWYVFDIRIINATYVNCTILNETDGQVLWSKNISSSIPSSPGRETGAGIVMYSTLIGAAANTMSIDFLMTSIPTPRRKWS